MNMKTIKALMNMLPDGEKKEALARKLEHLAPEATKAKGPGGLFDSFELKPTGHIMIEAIDEKGQVVGTLADQPNLVVNGAEEILLRAFSGDPNRQLYKNRVPKVSPTRKILIDESKLAGYGLFEGTQLIHAPNVIWAAVDDSLFDISYGYYPVTLYIKEEESLEVGKKAFTLSKTAAAGYVPISAETYSGYTNMFIGIGEGKNIPVSLTDSRLVYTDITPTESGAKTTIEGNSLKFKQKITNFAMEYEASNKGAQIDVFVNSVLKDTIETLDSSLVAPVVRTYEYDGLDNTVESEIRLVHSGSDNGVENPVMNIKALRFDALDKSMNSLMKEFKNFETDFLTPTTYNTTAIAPYTIQLANFPVLPGAVKVSYNDAEFTKVATEGELTDTTFMVDDIHGIIRLNRALTGVNVTYSITGEILDTKLVSTLVAEDVVYTTPTDIPVVGETASGALNSSNKTFTFARANAKKNTIVVKKNGVALAAEDIESINMETRTIILKVAPTVSQPITVDYTYVSDVVTRIPSNKYVAGFAIKEGSLKVYDHLGNEMTLAATKQEFGPGKYMLDSENKTLIRIATKAAGDVVIPKIEVKYKSDERPGIPTNYKRAIIDKPKTVNEYPWFELDKGAVRFVAEFPEMIPAHNVTIREMGLFDGPRAEDKVTGFRNFPVKAFSLVRVGETRKDTSTGIRITWTITLMNEQNQPFQGGRN